MPEYYTIKQVAEIVGITKSAVEWNRQKGRLGAIKTPTGRILISKEALAAFLAARNPETHDPNRHLYEIIRITCGMVDVLFRTHSLRELSLKYTHMLENNHKLVRIRMDGATLLICESDRIGYTYHPRTRTRGGKSVVEELERSGGHFEGDLPRYEQVGVQHGEEYPVLRRGADGASKDYLRDARAQAGKQKKSVPAIPQSEQGPVQGDSGEAEREKHAGVPARPGQRRHFTPEEKRLKNRERLKRWRQENPEKAREYDRQQYQKHREKKLERNKRYAREHPEKMQEYAKKYYWKKKEAAKDDHGTKSD